MHLRRIGLWVVVSCAPAWVGCTAILGSDFKDGPLEDGSVAPEDGSTHADTGTKKDAGSDAKSDATDAKSDTKSDAKGDAAKDAPGTDAPPGEKTLTVDVIGTGFVKSVDGSISCGEGKTHCSDSVVLGKSVVLSAAKTDGGVFSGWSGGGCTGTSTCVVKVDADVTVTANFTEPVLTIVDEGTGQGEVESSDSKLSCGIGLDAGACSSAYTAGTTVSLTALAATSSTFTGWSSGPCSGTSTSCDVTIGSTSESVTATFAADEVVTVSITGAGNVDSSDANIDCPSLACSYDYGQTSPALQLFAQPGPGSLFTAWTGGCTGNDPTCALSVTQSVSVGANFEPIATWDPAWSIAGAAFSNGDLAISNTSATILQVVYRTTVGHASGKWYWEVYANSGTVATDAGGLGIVGADAPNSCRYPGSEPSGLSFGYGTSEEQYFSSWSDTAVTAPPTTAPASSAIGKGNTYIFALDMDAGNFWAGVNGAWFGGGDPASGTTPIISGLTGLTIFAAASIYNNTESFTGNFGASGVWSFEVPDGFTPGF